MNQSYNDSISLIGTSTNASTFAAPIDASIVTRGLLIVLLIITMAIGITGNTVVCWIVYRKPAMQSAINILLAHLALSDILLAVLFLPIIITNLIAGSWVFGNIVCEVSAFIHNVLNYTGVYILLAISIDRYLIIVLHKEKLTTRRAKCIIILSWIISGFLSFPPTVGWGKYSIQAGVECNMGVSRDLPAKIYAVLVTILTTFLPLLLMLHAFLGIISTVKKKRVRVQDQPRDVSISYNRKIVAATLSVVRRVAVDMRFKTRSFKTILFLFLVLTACWVPYSIVTMFRSVLNQQDNVCTLLLLCLCCLKSAINPVIYCARIKKFREACVSFLPSRCMSISCLPTTLRRRVNPSSAYIVRGNLPRQ